MNGKQVLLGRSTALGDTADPPIPAQGCGRAEAFWLDWGERLLLLALFSLLVRRFIGAEGTGAYVANLLLLLSEGLVVFFILIRRRHREVSRRPAEWLLALGATCFSQFVSPGGEPLVAPVAAAFLLLVGLTVQVHAKITLGRSFGCVPANRGLKLAGPYQFVRHPMYAGYLLGHVSFLLVNPTVWNLAVYAGGYGMQIPRLLAEERLLRSDADYQAYMARVRYRLIPGLF
jgi:protein-S-isoprenylcysteine O-methyltransferase Ste14